MFAANCLPSIQIHTSDDCIFSQRVLKNFSRDETNSSIISVIIVIIIIHNFCKCKEQVGIFVPLLGANILLALDTLICNSRMGWGGEGFKRYHAIHAIKMFYKCICHYLCLFVGQVMSPHSNEISQRWQESQTVSETVKNQVSKLLGVWLVQLKGIGIPRVHQYGLT